MEVIPRIKCAFCPVSVADVPEAIATDWIPSYYLDIYDPFETSVPVCPACQVSRLAWNDEIGEYLLREKGKS